MDLEAVGIRLALPHRAAWLDLTDAPNTYFLAVQDARGRCGLGIGIDVRETRALPGHRFWQVQRLGVPVPEPLVQLALSALVDRARAEPWLLRVEVQVFGRDAVRDVWSGALGRLGFQRARRRRSYRETVVVDLTPEEGALFQSFHPTVRRHVRAVDKKGFVLRQLTDPSYSRRLAELCAEAFARTGGRHHEEAWHKIVPFAATHPNEARVVGLWRNGSHEPGDLVAFAVAYHHGDHAEYATAGSTRAPDLKVPLGYAIAWDLMCWARRLGASWFDFGGVTRGSKGDETDRRGGISDFKRMFSQNVLTCAEEWVLTVSPVRSAVADAVTRSARGWQRLWRT